MSGGFLYPRTPAEPTKRRLGYIVRGGIGAGGQMKCTRTAGMGYTNKNSAVSSASCLICVYGWKYLEGFLNRDWTLFCGAGVVYEPQLAKATTSCGVCDCAVWLWCRPGRSRFSSPVCWSWWGMEGFLERRWSSILIGCVGTPPACLLCYLLPGCPWLYELHSHSTISQCEWQMIVT